MKQLTTAEDMADVLGAENGPRIVAYVGQRVKECGHQLPLGQATQEQAYFLRDARKGYAAGGLRVIYQLTPVELPIGRACEVHFLLINVYETGEEMSRAMDEARTGEPSFKEF